MPCKCGSLNRGRMKKGDFIKRKIFILYRNSFIEARENGHYIGNVQHSLVLRSPLLELEQLCQNRHSSRAKNIDTLDTDSIFTKNVDILDH